jgi:hypothetical protein
MGVLFFATLYFDTLQFALNYFDLNLLPRFTRPLYYLPPDRPGPYLMKKTPSLIWIDRGREPLPSSSFTTRPEKESGGRRKPSRLPHRDPSRGREEGWWRDFREHGDNSAASGGGATPARRARGWARGSSPIRRCSVDQRVET